MNGSQLGSLVQGKEPNDDHKEASGLSVSRWKSRRSKMCLMLVVKGLARVERLCQSHAN
jgi:hypothetical protein